jgi:L-threonylcarbamoyladenylate synthase
VSTPQFLSNCTAADFAFAAEHLVAGGLVAFPTETVYGLGADACNLQAVARIYAAKGRPNDHPLIVHIPSMDSVKDWASEVPEYAITLGSTFWPGPMTLVLKRSELAGDFVTGRQITVGLRVPNHSVALALLEAFKKLGGKGLAAPSANRFGQVSPTNAPAVFDELGDYLDQNDLVLDGGDSEVGVESTIIDCTGLAPRVLRPGAISAAMIEKCTGLMITQSDSVIRVSGSLDNHYAPKAKVLISETPTPGQGFIAHESIATPVGVIRLASPTNDEEFARVLYSAMREADALGLYELVVAEPSGTGIAVAIRDRLGRAAKKH